MNPDFMRSLLKEQPFVPFRIFLSNGGFHVVKHPENAIVMKTRIILVYPDTDSVRFVSLLHVNEIRLKTHAEINSWRLPDGKREGPRT